MNKELKGILESDLLERYLMGEVSEQEREKVLELRRTSPEIKDALDKLEETLEQVALDEQMTQPAGLRDKILRQNYDAAPRSLSRGSNFSWIAYAASLLLVAGGVWFWQQQRIDELEAKAAAAILQMAQLEADCQKTNREFALINAPDTRPAVLTGTDYAPNSSVIVYWNPTERACLLRVGELPDIPSDKTYQLWADIDGEMNSLGTFDHQLAQKELLTMAYLDHAESLNVTVEPAGGNDHATVSTLSAAVAI
ncbi:MAG: anti-sigma factor [Bacteroidota bacterium]